MRRKRPSAPMPRWRWQRRTTCSGVRRISPLRLSMRMKSLPAPFILVNAKFMGGKNRPIWRKLKNFVGTLDHVPLFTRLAPKEIRHGWIVGNVFGGSVPFNFAAGAISDVAEMRDVGRAMTDLDVGDRFLP